MPELRKVAHHAVEKPAPLRPPSRHRRSLVLTALASLLVVAAGLALYRYVPALRPKLPDAIVGLPTAPKPSETKMNANPENGDDRLTPFSPRDFGSRARFSSPIVVVGPFEPLRGDILTNEESAYALDGIEAPPASAICLGGDKRLWACGLQARAALNGLVRGKDLICRLKSGRPQRKPRDPGTARWHCSADGKDIALALVDGGWAKPANRDDRAIFAARDAAQAHQRGLWDGDWNIVRVPEAAP